MEYEDELLKQFVEMASEVTQGIGRALRAYPQGNVTAEDLGAPLEKIVGIGVRAVLDGLIGRCKEENRNLKRPQLDAAIFFSTARLFETEFERQKTNIDKKYLVDIGEHDETRLERSQVPNWMLYEITIPLFMGEVAPPPRPDLRSIPGGKPDPEPKPE